MVKGIWAWLGLLSFWSAMAWGTALAVAFELVTCIFRFGLDLQSSQDTLYFASFTFGYRIHHGYLGLLALLLLCVIPGRSWRRLFLMIGLCLAVSDLVHHLLVLWPITGSPEFDLRYPD